MEKLIGLEGGHNETWFKVLDTKETTVKNYPSIKDGKVQSVLDVDMDDFLRHKKEVVVSGHFAMVAGNAVCAAEGIKDALGTEYSAVAVNPNCVEIYSVADYDEQVKRACESR
jgi:hypothetical protein